MYINLAQRDEPVSWNVIESIIASARGHMYDIEDCIVSHRVENRRRSRYESPLAETRGRGRLPRIELPHFDGSAEWESFRDLFTPLGHNILRLSDLERQWYLKSCITGEASIALKGVQITNSTYHSAWRALVTRYDNKRVFTTCVWTCTRAV